MAVNFNSTDNLPASSDGPNVLVDSTVNGVVLLSDGSSNQALFANGQYKVPAGSGDVIGPASSVAGNLPSFSDTSGKLIGDSGIPANSVGGTAVEKTTDYTIPANNYIVFVDASGGDVEITMPAASLGDSQTVIKTSNTGGMVTIIAAAGNVQNDTSVILEANEFASVPFKSDSTNWWII